MIYITGDCHSDVRRLSADSFYEQKEMNNQNENFIIILGDFGLVWNQDVESKTEKYWLDWLENKPFTTLFVDGNHECVNSKSDVLTEYGWMNIKDVYNSSENIKIASVDMDTREIVYDYPLDKIRTYSNTIIDIEGVNYKQSVTPNHDVIVDNKKIKASELLGQNIFEEQLRFEVSEKENGIDLSPEIIEILTTIVMDATIVDYNKKNPNSHKIRIQYHLKKERKINYIMNILDDSNIHYTVRQGKNDDTFICIHGEQGRMLYDLLERKKELPYYFVNMNRKQFQSLFHAISQTDGTVRENNVIWRTTSLNDANIVQELCIKHNYDMYINKIGYKSGYETENSKVQYHCSFGFNKNLHRRISIQERDYNDYAYCFTMPKGTLITRYEYCSCITGNCFDRLYQYPTKEWKGGKVHEIRPHVLHLCRGEVFDIEGKKFFTFGGAASHDIYDGILDPDDFETYDDFKDTWKRWNKNGKIFRVKNISWWERELPSEEEMQSGIKNLEKHNWKVDYILTHSPSASVIALLGHGLYKQDILTKYLEDIRSKTEYKRHYCGHMHINEQLNDKDVLLYEQIIRIV